MIMTFLQIIDNITHALFCFSITNTEDPLKVSLVLFRITNNLDWNILGKFGIKSWYQEGHQDTKRYASYVIDERRTH